MQLNVTHELYRFEYLELNRERFEKCGALISGYDDGSAHYTVSQGELLCDAQFRMNVK